MTSLTQSQSIYSPDNLYQLLLTGTGTANPGDLRLRYCASGFSGNQCADSSAPSGKWRSLTNGGTFANFQGDGNLVVYEGPVPPDTGSNTALWNAGTCSGCITGGGQGVRLYLPGPDSVCTCQTLLCIVVELSGGGGGVVYYYAVTSGDPFTNTLASCPAAP